MGEYSLPLGLRADLQKIHTGVATFTIHSQFARGPFTIKGKVDLSKNSWQAVFSTKSLSTACLQDLLPVYAPIEFKGRIEGNSSLSGSVIPFWVDYDSHIQTHSFAITYQGQPLIFPPNIANSLGTAIRLEGDLNHLQAIINIPNLAPPLRGSLRADLEAVRQKKSAVIKGHTLVTIPKGRRQQLDLHTPVELENRFTLNISPHRHSEDTTKIEFEFKGVPQKREITAVINDIKVTSSPLKIVIDGRRQQNNTIGYNLTMKNAPISFAKPGMSGKGHISIQGEGYFPDASAQNGRFKAALTIKEGSLDLKGVSLNKIKARFPISWPPNPAATQKGFLTIGQITDTNSNEAKATATLELRGATYTLNGRLTSPQLPGLLPVINLTSEIHKRFLATNLRITMPKSSFSSDLLHLPMLEGLQIKGDIALKTHLAISPNHLNGEAAIHLENCDIDQKSAALSVRGLVLDLNLPRLPEIISSPVPFTIKEVLAQDTRFTQGRGTFQFTSQEITVRHSTINWCGGRIYLMGTTFNHEGTSRNITVFCEGLRLSDLLQQLGIKRAYGDGRVNGKITMSISHGQVTLSDAFLYSTPGTGGTIRLNGDDLLLMGVPQGSPQYNELAFAGAALKEFKYRWVTLKLSPEESGSVLSLKMAGKPQSPLPFRYDANQHTFIRLQDTKGGINYPIDLDVNFHLPLNKIINYGRSFKDFFSDFSPSK